MASLVIAAAATTLGLSFAGIWLFLAPVLAGIPELDEERALREAEQTQLRERNEGRIFGSGDRPQYRPRHAQDSMAQEVRDPDSSRRAGSAYYGR